MGKIKKRAGFTLIEVIVAMGIFFIVLIAFLGSYYSYYRNVQYTRYKTIGENLAQLQLEDIQNLSASVLKIIVGETDEAGPGLGIYLPNYPKDTNPVPAIYDSGDGISHPFIDSSFSIDNLSNICGTESPDPPPTLLLPNSIVVTSVPVLGEGGFPTGDYTYTLALYKETFPSYTKEIYIEDKTPTIEITSKKIFEIHVTVSWNINGSQKSVTITGEKNDARTQ
jgi:prepilin-type N-terminal cleavage/methylation domain-containing protein